MATKVMHLVNGAGMPACDRNRFAGADSTASKPSEVTCKRCRRTRRWALRHSEQLTGEARQAARAVGIVEYMTVRDRATGDLGMVNRIEGTKILVSYWGRVRQTVAYSCPAEAAEAVTWVRPRHLAKVGFFLRTPGSSYEVTDIVGDVFHLAEIKLDSRRLSSQTLSEVAAQVAQGFMTVGDYLGQPVDVKGVDLHA